MTVKADGSYGKAGMSVINQIQSLKMMEIYIEYIESIITASKL